MKSIKRVLISRTDRMGDVILSTPVASAIKQNDKNTQVYFLAREYTTDVLELHPDVDGVIRIDPLEHKQSLYDLINELRQYNFDAVLALFPRPQLALAFALAGIPMRIGSGFRWYSFLYNHRIFEHRKNAVRHETEYNLQLLRPFGIDAAQVVFNYKPDGAASKQVTEKLLALGITGNYIVLHPGSGGSARDWPPEYFAQLADNIITQLGLQVIITGSDNEKVIVQNIISHSDQKVVNFCGSLSIKELAALFEHAALFVSNSTGPLHLARMVQTQVVAFYPPILACRPERWGPYGLRGNVLMSTQEECFACRKTNERVCACMRAISVEEAMKIVTETISNQCTI